jgi:hypothetical protein
VLFLDYENGGGSSSYARSSYIRPRDQFMEGISFDFEQSSKYSIAANLIFFMPIYSPKASRIFSNILLVLV